MNFFGIKSIAAIILMSLFLVGSASASGPFNIISSVSPQNPAPNNATNFTFNVTNIGGGSMKNIRIYAPSGFQINNLISCPSGTTTNTSNSSFVECKKCSGSGWSGVQQIKLIATTANICALFTWNVTANTGCNGQDDSDVAPANISVCAPATPIAITLVNPANGSTANTTPVFSWTTNYANATCNLTIDGVVNRTGINGTLGNYSTTATGTLSGGNHTWNVSCSSGSLRNSSATWSFNVLIPNPYITVTKVVINNNGGTKAVSSFPLFVGNTSVTSGAAQQFAAGTYVVSETNATGYNATFSGNCSSNGTITMQTGLNYTCSITNDDNPATLTVNKIVVNDNGGSATVGSFALKVNSTNVTSGTPASFNAGAYVVSETGPSGYSATFSGDCSSSGAITLQNGESKVCNITNDDIAPRLTVTKTVVNNNGGNAVVSDFPLFVGNVSVASGAQNTFNAGTYQLSETGQSGYTASSWGGNCSANGTITLAPGNNYSCTITNDDQAASITLIKNVSNNNGGSAGVNDFGLSIGNTSVNSSQTLSVNANAAYAINEAGLAGYSFVSISGAGCPQSLGGTVTLNEGQSITCTITNDDNGASITVTKLVTNNNGGTAAAGDFTLRLDGSAVASGAPNAASPGTHTVSEDAFAGYTGTIGGDCATNGSVTIALGQNKSCTITNDDEQPKLAVIKIVNNTNGGTKTISDFPLFVNGTSVTSGAQNGFNAGTYTVSETQQPGYSAVYSGACNAQGQVTLAVGDVKNCTITNSDSVQPTLTVIKNVTNNNGGTKQVADFGLLVGATQVTSGAANQFAAGTYAVSETNAGGYSAAYSGACNSSGQVTLLPGDNKTCTITNDDEQGTLTVIKQFVNDNGGSVTTATLYIDDGQVSNNTPNSLDAGTYAVSEDAISGYTATFSGDCDSEGSVTLGNGESKTCTITNDDQQGTLTVIKQFVNDNGGSVTTATLYIDDSQVSNNTPNSLDAGTYTVSEDAISGYTAAFSGDCDSQGSVTLGNGESKTCTITNDDQAATLTVYKYVTNDNGGDAASSDFTMSVTGTNPSPSSFAGDDEGTVVTLDAGQYSVGEDGPSGYGASYSEDCSGTIANGESRTCEVTNDDLAASITLVKEVINDNGGSAGENDFGLSIGETGVDSGQTLEVDANTAYALDEEGLAGYIFTGISGDEGCPSELGGTVALGEGESITCTITNDDEQATLTVYKVVDNSNGGTANSSGFDITVSDDYEYEETFAGNESGTLLTLDSGTYYISETQLQGYSAEYSGDCVDEEGVSVTLTPGSNLTCTITNSDNVQPTLTVYKVVINGSEEVGPSSFTIHVMLIDSGDVEGSPQPGSSSGTQYTLATGQYQVSEDALQGYTGAFSSDCVVNGQVSLLPGDNKECTVTNTLVPNSPPVINELSLSQSGSAMTCSIRASDAESGILAVSYTLSKNGVLQVNGTANVTNNTPTALASAGGVGFSETWSCEVVVSDGTDTAPGSVTVSTGSPPPGPGPGPSSGGGPCISCRGPSGPGSGGGNKTPEEPPATITQPVAQTTPTRQPTNPFAGFILPFGGTDDTGELIGAQIGENLPEPTTGAALFGLNLPFEPWVCALPLILLLLIALWYLLKNKKKPAAAPPKK